MPLTNKYLKYSPEITLEIFTLIWESFIRARYDLGAGLNTIFNNWKRWNHIILNENSLYTTNNPSLIDKLSQTTVQEILGYDPFIKDDFVLPEKWCIKRNSQNCEVINEYINKNWYKSGDKAGSENYFVYKSDNSYGWTSSNIKPGDYTEITFEQFKKYVLKDYIEISKETEPQYVECISVATCNTKIGEIFKCRYSNGSFEFEYNDKSKENFNSWDGWSVPWSDKLPQKHFKPSTKEAFDAQNQPKIKLEDLRKKAIELIKNGFTNKIRNGIDKFKTPSISALKESDYISFMEYLNSIDNPKQPLKQAVHCTTQEEWDFVTEKLGYKWKTGYFNEDSSWISLNSNQHSSEKYWKKHNYQILSFQEWCNLNGYKMEKSKQEILKEFAEKYPPGTKVKSPDGIEFIISTTHKHKGENNDFLQNSPYYTGLRGEVLAVKENSCIGEYLYKDGKYAEIIKNAPKFEAGKWYRVTDGEYKDIGKDIWYAKSPKLINGIIICEEHIYQKINKGGNFGKLGEYTFTEVSIEEIQQYLPYNHPDKIKSNPEFKVGDYVTIIKSNKNWIDQMDKEVGKTVKITSISAEAYIEYTGKPGWSFGARDGHFRHATPEEINNHLISIGQIPAGEPLNAGIKSNKDGTFWTGLAPTNHLGAMYLGDIMGNPIKLKMILSIDDEELPMVNIIKTNTVKQLLNND